jgi:hypothetical protein
MNSFSCSCRRRYCGPLATLLCENFLCLRRLALTEQSSGGEFTLGWPSSRERLNWAGSRGRCGASSRVSRDESDAFGGQSAAQCTATSTATSTENSTELSSETSTETSTATATTYICVIPSGLWGTVLHSRHALYIDSGRVCRLTVVSE